MAGNAKTRGEFNDYDSFVEKFKTKKTTDDCYTPSNIMEAVQNYVTERYGYGRERMVRPFWPGGNYERFEYPDGCCVVDNPPFSIIKQICKDFQERHIPFFLFCPYLTSAGLTKVKGVTVIVAPAAIRYENGAEVPTCFVTNMEPDLILRGDPDLMDALKAVDATNRSAMKNSLPKYEYPDEVLTISKVGWFTVHHTPYALSRRDCCIIDDMDAQRRVGKSIFGSGFLLSERAAVERAAVERAAATKWPLSDRERKMVELLGKM